MAVIDHKTFEKQIRKSLPNLYRLAFGILHNRADAEDAVSETLLRAYDKLHTLREADHFAQIQTSRVGADHYSRPFTEHEQTRMEELKISYEEAAVFPEKVLTIHER